MAVTLVVVLAVIAGTAVVAQRSFDGFVGSRFQGRAKDARLTAEAGTAFVISEWNRPANRALYTGVPMGQWASTKNQCTAPSPAFDINAAAVPTADATSFANGVEVELPSANDGTRRTFRLLRATFASNNRNNTFTITTSPASTSGSSPVISQANARGFLELEVEGLIYQAGNQDPVATSRVIREFIIEPKCCNRSFGGILPNDPDSALNPLGNDSRPCEGDSPTFGELSVVTGLGGGGLTPQSGSSALTLLVGNGNESLNQVTCNPPGGATSCPGYQQETINTSLGPIEYNVRKFDIDDPPQMPEPRDPLAVNNRTVEGGQLRITPPVAAPPPNSEDPDGSHPSNCVTRDGAYHCYISEINLSGNRSLFIDTQNMPVYLHLQQGSSSSINLSGNAFIKHIKGSDTNFAPPSSSTDFQIRGLPRNSDGICPSGETQNFNFSGNSISAFLLWAPCSNTTLTGTSGWSGILWTNILNLNGNTTLRAAVPSNNGTCAANPSEPICSIVGADPSPLDWSARSINFTRFF